MLPIYAIKLVLKNINANGTGFPLHTSRRKEKVNEKTFMLQFGCCLLGWMNHSIDVNNKIRSIQESALRLAHENFKLSFRQLLEKDYYSSVQNAKDKKSAVIWLLKL